VPNVPSEVWKEDDSILIGAFAPLSLGAGGCDDPASVNYRLALQELNADNIGGLPPGRKVSVVICDNQALGAGSEAEKSVLVDQASKHLVEALRVPAILAAVTQPDLVAMTNTYAKPNGVFLMNPFGATDATATLDDAGLVWHMLGQPEDLAATYAALVQAMEPVVPTLLNQPGPLRVLVIAGNDELSVELTPALAGSVTFNGKSWAENITDGNLVVGVATDTASAQALGTELLSMDPHIVISTSHFALPVWESGDTGGVRPFFVLSPLDFADHEAWKISIELSKNASNLPDVEDRFVFVNPAATEDIDLIQAYRARLTSILPASLDFSAENAYDAAYYLLYSLSRGGDPATGTKMAADGMPALMAAAPELDVGPDDMDQVFAALEAPGGQVRLNGLMGPPTFDTNGVHTMTGQLECFMTLVAVPGNAELELYTHVGHFDATTNVLRKAQQYAGSPVPCLDWLNLPDP
jgi:hypothetical protein